MIKELGFGVDLVTTFETSGGGAAGGADAGDACGAGAHDAGIDYGVLAADIAADNMAAHIAAEAEKETAEEAAEEAAAAAARVGVQAAWQAELSGGRRVTTPTPFYSPLSHDWSDVLGNIPIPCWDQRLSEILGFIRRKEPWEIKPEDARLLLVSRLARGGALQVPSLKHANWVHKSAPHVFFVEGDGQDMGDIGESDYERVTTSGALSHTVTQFPDLIAVKRASCSPGRDTPNPKKVGEWQLALLEGRPDFGSHTFRGMELKKEREYGRDKPGNQVQAQTVWPETRSLGPRHEQETQGRSWLELVDPGRCMGRCWLELELNDSWAEGCGIYPSVALSAPGQISTVCGALFSVYHTTLMSHVSVAPRTNKDEDSPRVRHK